MALLINGALDKKLSPIDEKLDKMNGRLATLEGWKEGIGVLKSGFLSRAGISLVRE